MMGDSEGIWRFRAFLPPVLRECEVTLGEGNTPLRRLARLGEELGLDDLWMKDESKNPTGSQKDRLEAVLVSRAKAEGKPGVAIASTGNQGSATAAYASVAGLPCTIFTTPNVSRTMKVQMQSYGARLYMTETSGKRIEILRKVVDELGYAPASGIAVPPVGSSCYAVDGYKTIAYEIFEQLGCAPDWLIVPISYGDTLYGIYKGMKDLVDMGLIPKLPRMAAAEVFGAAEKSLEEFEKKARSEAPETANGAVPADWHTTLKPVAQPDGPSIQTSIATGHVAYTTLCALHDSDGVARSSHDDEAAGMQMHFARKEGVFAELASVASLVVLKKLVEEGMIQARDKVVVVITSSGIKDPESASRMLPEVPLIRPELDEL